MSSTSLALSSSTRSGVLVRLLALARSRLALVAAGLTLVLLWGGLVATHRMTPQALPRALAEHAALTEPSTAKMLASVRWDRVEPIPMDPHYEILVFYRGVRMVASVAVGYKGRAMILDAVDWRLQKYAYGSNIANDLRVLALLAIVFLLMTAVWPLWRLRNLDVLVVLSLTLSVMLYNGGLLASMAMVTYPALIYLAFRCAWRGLGPVRAPSGATPLYEHLTRSLSAAQRIRLLRMALTALALITAMVGFTSLHVLDVGYAVMEGATLIVHGVLPYGHIPDVLHGDTYPLGSYLMYVPLALVWPVHTVWDDADVTLVVAIGAVLLGAFWLSRLAVTRVKAAINDEGGTDVQGRSSAERSRGLRAAIAMLAFPPMLVTVSTGTTDVSLAAMLLAAFVMWRRPARGSAALSIAAWFKLAPVLLLPLWLARLRGGALRAAVAGIVAVTAVLGGFLIALGGPGAPLEMFRAMSFQFTRSSPLTLWAVVGSVPLQQLAAAATVALLVGSCVRIRRDPDLAADRWRTAAISASLLLGVQIAANYWNYMYLAWTFPLLALPLLIAQDSASHPARVRAEE